MKLSEIIDTFQEDYDSSLENDDYQKQFDILEKSIINWASDKCKKQREICSKSAFIKIGSLEFEKPVKQHYTNGDRFYQIDEDSILLSSEPNYYD